MPFSVCMSLQHGQSFMSSQQHSSPAFIFWQQGQVIILVDGVVVAHAPSTNALKQANIENMERQRFDLDSI